MEIKANRARLGAMFILLVGVGIFAMLPDGWPIPWYLRPLTVTLLLVIAFINGIEAERVVITEKYGKWIKFT